MAALLLLSGAQWTGYLPLNYTLMGADTFSGDPDLVITLYDYGNLANALATHTVGESFVLSCFESIVAPDGRTPKGMSAGLQAQITVGADDTSHEITELRKVVFSEFDNRIYNFWNFTDSTTRDPSNAGTNALTYFTGPSGGDSAYTVAENKWEFNLNSGSNINPAIWAKHTADIQSCFISDTETALDGLSELSIPGWADCSSNTNKFCPNDQDETISVNLPTPGNSDDGTSSLNSWGALTCWDTVTDVTVPGSFPAPGTLGIEVVLSSDGSASSAGVVAHEISFIYATTDGSTYEYVGAPYERLNELPAMNSVDDTDFDFEITGINCQHVLHF